MWQFVRPANLIIVGSVGCKGGGFVTVSVPRVGNLGMWIWHIPICVRLDVIFVVILSIGLKSAPVGVSYAMAATIIKRQLMGL